MNRTYLNSKAADDARRALLFNGNFFLYSSRPSVRRLCEHAQKLIAATFPSLDPQRAQYQMKVEDFVTAVGPLKSKFTNDSVTKGIVQEILADFGLDPHETYFDVPRLRVVTSDKFLTSGVGYAYKAHRDTWYASPGCQINWWLPVYDLDVEQTLALYPHYWANPIKNSSGDFDYDEWCRVGRQLATSQIGTDTRKHPLPLEEVKTDDELRVICNSAEMILFSAAHLHATVPNTAGTTRFSIDFRTLHIGDLRSGLGAPSIDNSSRGTTLRDFLSATDFAPLPPELVELGANGNLAATA
jgi:hypothetical protein